MSGLDINDYIEKAKRLTTPEISDALDYFSLPGSLLGIKHIAGKNAFVGTMPDGQIYCRRQGQYGHRR